MLGEMFRGCRGSFLLVSSFWTLITSIAIAEGPRVLSASTVEGAGVVGDPVQRRAWVHHAVIPWERLPHVAERYGVTEAEIRQWNQLGDAKQPLRSNMTLRIHAGRFPPPRSSMTYTVKEERLSAIAKRYGCTVKEILRWNPRLGRRRVEAGTRVVLWLDSSLPGIGSGVRGKRIPTKPVPDGGVSSGRPFRGRLINGVRLPDSELYTIRIPHQAFGTSLAVRNIQQAIADFRFRSGFQGEVVISAMSRRGGRKLPPHRSHQSGRDVDIWLPAMPHAHPGMKPAPDEIDWHASWLLIKAFADTGAVKRIYLENSAFRRLRRASKEYGVSWEEFSSLVSGSGLVWHSPGHDCHIHVRFKCTPGVPRCRE